jgi:hypothetical protein
MSEIEVYHFVTRDKGDVDKLTWRRLATLESIKRCGGQPIMETRHCVDTSELDENGFLKELPAPSV